MDYEEKHEIIKMTRKGYMEAKAVEEVRNAALKETEAATIVNSYAEAEAIGYSADDLGLLPDSITVDAGCANPIAVAGLKEGEQVIIVGYRTAADIFLAAAKVGLKGHVVGIEESPEEVTLIRTAAKAADYASIEVRVGEDENLPVADKSFDAAITNCAITFSGDKPRVIREMFRALKPGGRILLCEPVINKSASRAVMATVREYLECLESGFFKEDYLRALKKAGFKKIKAIDEIAFPVSRMQKDSKAAALLASNAIDAAALEGITSATSSVKITAVRP